MEDFVSQLQNGLQEADLPPIDVTKAQLATVGMIACAVILVIALLNCFFGLKLMKLWITILGLMIGFGLGFGISAAMGATKMVAMAIGAVAGIALGAIGFFLYLVGVFILSWFLGFSMVLGFAGTVNGTICIVGAIVGLLLAILAVKFVEPIVIILTSLQGGLMAGTVLTYMIHVPGAYTDLVIGIVLAILGIVVQFVMESQKKAKLHIKKANEVRKENSTENEVEKLRSALDNTDKVMEDKDADDYYDDEDEDER